MDLHVKSHTYAKNTKVSCATSLQPHEILKKSMKSGLIQ